MCIRDSVGDAFRSQARPCGRATDDRAVGARDLRELGGFHQSSEDQRGACHRRAPHQPAVDQRMHEVQREFAGDVGRQSDGRRPFRERLDEAHDRFALSLIHI